MTTQSIKILFLISVTRKNKKGFVPLICRITYLGKRKPFATGIYIDPDNWDSSYQLTKPNNEHNNQINTQLSLIKQEINQAFLFLQVQKERFDVEDIYLKYKGTDTKQSKTLIEVFTLHNTKMNSLVGIEYTKSTYSKFIEAKQHTEDFLFYQYKKKIFY
ncbi:Arm DNA-binding domain-containing protein [Flavobacterium nitratireducens]|uniref:Arm DNA-binding domain-containing protein n=1 Tax=Flavobacterium nitratireducens TaxID=992289 RepID=UPI0030F9950A